MAVNSYFHAGKGVGNEGEHDIVEKLIIEAIQIHGQDFYYIPRTLNKIDEIYQEDVLSSFENYYVLEMYVDNIESFGGQGELLGKFGFELDDQVELVVSRTRFSQETGEDKPAEGDLLWFPLTGRMFQINWVSEKDIFYQLSKNHTYKLRCSTWTYSHEEVDTSIEEVDSSFKNIIDRYEKNNEIEEEANDIIDYSEDNPFGEK